VPAAAAREELARFQQPADVTNTHIEPGEPDAVMSEIGAGRAPPHPRVGAGQLMSAG
jgi:hypothetical protein